MPKLGQNQKFKNTGKLSQTLKLGHCNRICSLLSPTFPPFSLPLPVPPTENLNISQLLFAPPLRCNSSKYSWWTSLFDVSFRRYKRVLYFSVGFFFRTPFHLIHRTSNIFFIISWMFYICCPTNFSNRKFKNSVQLTKANTMWNRMKKIFNLS